MNTITGEMLDSFDLKLNKHIRIEGQVYNETFDFPHFDDKYAPPPSGSQAHIHNYHDGPLPFEDDQYFDPSPYDSQHIVNLDDGPQYRSEECCEGKECRSRCLPYR